MVAPPAAPGYGPNPTRQDLLQDEDVTEDLDQCWTRMQTTIEQGFKYAHEKIDNIDKTLSGNGQPGLIREVQDLKTQIVDYVKLSNRRIGWAIALLSAIGGAVIPWLLGVLSEWFKAKH
jgi:hypothetical protein